MNANDATKIKRLLFEAYVLKAATKVSQTEEFIKGYAWGIETVAVKIDMPVSAMWDVTELAKEWAEIKCPAIQIGDECEKGCDACRSAAARLIG